MVLNKTGKSSILLFADWFEPGFRAGGPIRSCLNFAQQMKDEYSVYIVTTDRDLNSSSPYEDVVIDKWTEFDKGLKILYCSPALLNWKTILRQIRSVGPDFIYMNSMYSRFFTIYPVLMKKLGLINAGLILAPRGMLRPTAIQYKSLKKKIFFSIMRLMGIHQLVRFHATDVSELNHINEQFGRKTNVAVIPNFAATIKTHLRQVKKEEKEISIVFIGRIHPIKNLDYLLRLLPSITGSVRITITGSEEDISYVSLCKTLTAHLPGNIIVNFKKELPYKQLLELIAEHHILALPTQGENFGHAIFDAMAQGRPVLISDQTPWRNLAALKAGWDISLSDKEAFIKALQQAIDFNQQDYNEWSLGAWNYAKHFAETSNIKDSYRKLFS